MDFPGIATGSWNKWRRLLEAEISHQVGTLEDEPSSKVSREQLAMETLSGYWLECSLSEPSSGTLTN